MQLQEVLESYSAEEASVARLFGDAGVSIRGRAGHRGADPVFMARLAETYDLISRTSRGDWRAEYRLREAMTTSDFPLFFGDIIDRSAWQSYTAWTPQYQNYTQRRVLRDFQTANIFAFDGAQAQLDLVPENTEYPAAALAETRYQVTVQKHGRRLPLTWEMVVNNGARGGGLTDDIPAAFANAARRSEEKDVAKLFVDVSGPHATLFNNTNKNLVNTTNGAASNNPVLSISGIQEGLKVLARQVDADGEPIVFDSLELVVPTALRPTADQIVNTTEFRAIDTGSNIRIIRGNGIANALRVSTNPYISTIATTANGTTSWFLFATPAPGQRRALIIAFLTGFEEPATFMKEPNQRRVGGGAVSELEGSFETDALDYKIRHVWGTARGDPKTAVASNGSGA
jgi:hypothetical protein